MFSTYLRKLLNCIRGWLFNWADLQPSMCAVSAYGGRAIARGVEEDILIEPGWVLISMVLWLRDETVSWQCSMAHWAFGSELSRADCSGAFRVWCKESILRNTGVLAPVMLANVQA